MDGPDAPPAPGFAYRKKISLIAPTSTDLVDYPAAIIVPPDPQFAMHIVEQDLWFSAADGTTALPYEIERLDPATGGLNVWVRIPRLAGDGITDLYLHYGPVIGDPPAPNNPLIVWPDTYAAIWHLTGDLARIEDSTGSGHDLSQLDPARQPMIGKGIAGQSRLFDGASTIAEADKLRAGHRQELNPVPNQSFTYACWVKVTTPAAPYDMPLYKGGAAGSVAGYDFELGDFDWTAQISDGAGTINKVIIGTTDATALRGGWVHLATVLDRDNSEMVVYINGSRAGSTMLTVADLANTEDVSLSMPGSDLQNRFAGEIDEVRLAHRAFDASWIRTEYRNLAFPETFLEIGSEEPLR